MTEPAVRTIDYTALLSPVLKADVAAFKTAMKAAGKSAGTRVGSIIGIVMLGPVALIVGLSELANLLGLLLSASVKSVRASEVAGLVVGAVFFLLLVGAIVLFARNLASMKLWERYFRLDWFARANGMMFSPADAHPNYPGAIFGQGGERVATNHFRSVGSRFLDLGNYSYVTGSGKTRQTHNWGFLAFNLDRSLPHMVLDSRANNGLFGGTNLPAVFGKKQVLSLEGNFNDYFTLYCPEQYERDALYVFTPDLMALLIDEAAPFDVEIIDNWMFVYSSGHFDSMNPAVYHRLFRIIDTVGAKTLSQTGRYADDRVPDRSANTVAPQGRRLKRGWPVGATIALVIVALGWIVPQLAGLIAVLFPR